MASPATPVPSSGPSLFSAIKSRLASKITPSNVAGVATRFGSGTLRGSGLLATAATGATIGAGMAISKKVIQSDGWAIFFLALFSAGIHAIDYSFFQFAYSPVRILIYIVLAIVFAGTLYSDQDEARTQTLKAIIYAWLFFFVFTNFFVKYFPTILPQRGLLELFLGLAFLGISAAKPGIFVKQPVIAPIFNMFIFSSFLMPYLGYGLFDQFFTNGGTFVYILKNYASALFWPVWFWYVLFFTHYKSLPMRLFSVLCLILFLSPAWYVSYQTQIIGADGTGVTQQQKSVYFQYWSDVQDTSKILGQNSMTIYNSSYVSVECWFWGFQGQLGSVTGGTSTAEHDKICNAATGSSGSSVADGFDTSVESGATSAAGISLDPIIATQQKYYPKQEMTFLSLLKAKSFGTQIDVTTSCFAKPIGGLDADGKLGTIDNPTFTVLGSANRDLTCKIPQGNTLVGGKSYELDINAAFNYVTSAYLRQYFTKQGLLSQFTSKSQSPQDGFFSFYQITDSNPKSIATRGPVLAGLDVANPVFELADPSTGVTNSFTVRLLVKNVPTWNGKIKSVNSIMLSLPKGLEIKNGIPKAKPKDVVGDVTWSDLSCTVSGLVGNFQLLSADSCDAMNSDPTSTYQNINCKDYNNYLLKPTPDSSIKTFAIDPGQEKTQQIYLTCDVATTNPTQILGGAPYAVKSIRMSTAYVYSLTQSKTFKVESSLANDNTAYDDKVLSARNFCGADNSYTLSPSLDKVFVGKTVSADNTLRQTYNAMVDTITQSIAATGGTGTNILTSSDCFSKSIEQAIVLNSWNQVVGNPMVDNSFYGYLQAKKSMITYINSAPNKDSPTKIDLIPYGYVSADALALDANAFDTFMRTKNLAVGMSYVDQLRADCKVTNGGADDMTCVIGKYLCGTTYKDGDVSNFCGQKTVPDVVTLATQISQIVTQSATSSSSASTSSTTGGVTSG